ncbi:hypothetical protein DFS34DRAFT_7400 [Phlyctochytrium arcticum]|nr:hypothetical protein DFS34DRAFT_7400 [Phlyctochytrium arcticum]
MDHSMIPLEHLAILGTPVLLSSALQPQQPERKTRTAVNRGPRWEPWSTSYVNDTEFNNMFRMSRADFVWLVNTLRPRLRVDQRSRGQPLPVEMQVAVALYRFGHGATYNTIGHLFRIAEGTALAVTTKVVAAIRNELAHRTLAYPPLSDEASQGHSGRRERLHASRHYRGCSGHGL